MELVTRKTTLDEFISSNKWFIKDPTTHLLCQVVLENTMAGRAKFMFTVQSHKSGRPHKYLRIKSGGNRVIVDKAEVILTAIKEGDFVLDY